MASGPSFLCKSVQEMNDWLHLLNKRKFNC